MSTHENITEAFNRYIEENEKFETKGVKASAARARKALGDMQKLSKVRRKEVQERKLAM